MQNKPAAAKTARDIYNKIRRDLPVGLELISKVVEAMRSLSSVEQEQLSRLFIPDLHAWGALIIGKAPPPVPLMRKKESPAAVRRFAVRLVAHDLKGLSDIITQAARRADKQFFIELGKCLSGKITAEYYDTLDFAIAKIVCADPSIKAGDAVRELERLGHPRISEENFRMRKKRLRLTKFTRQFSRQISRGKT